MRTPNCKCVICGKPLYRRPNELAKVRHVACMAHRAEAQKSSGITLAQQAGLSLGRRKGTNNLAGIPKSEESKQKRSESMKRWANENPDAVLARSEGTRGEKHYNWKGGLSKLSQSIRQMTEYRKWMDAVKARDGFMCVRCGANDNLESHHKRSFAELLKSHGVSSRDDARRCAELWDVENGETLCVPCHFEEHGRKLNENRRRNVSKAA